MNTVGDWLSRNPNQTLSYGGLIVLALMVLGVIDDRIGEALLVTLLGTSGGTATKRTKGGTTNKRTEGGTTNGTGWLQ